MTDHYYYFNRNLRLLTWALPVSFVIVRTRAPDKLVIGRRLIVYAWRAGGPAGRRTGRAADTRIRGYADTRICRSPRARRPRASAPRPPKRNDNYIWAPPGDVELYSLPGQLARADKC